MDNRPRGGKQGGRKHRRRPRHKKRAAVVRHGGCLLDRLVPCCAPKAASDSLPGQDDGFGNLPDELVAAILRHLPCLDLCRAVAQVCRRWHVVVHDAAAMGRPLCASARAREAFLCGPLMDVWASGYWCHALWESLKPTRRRRPSVVLARMLAAESGHIDCIAHLDAHPWYDGACIVPAAARGRLDVLRYAHENGCTWHWAVCAAAEEYGRVECLRYANGTGCHWSGHCDDAASNGHTDVLRYAREQGLQGHDVVCRFAALGGHVDTLRYACENGWPTCVMTSWSAARGGHLDVLKYIRESGGEWDAGTTSAAASNGRIGCLDYLLKNGCPGFVTACDAAAGKGRMRALRWLRARGCPWSEETCAAAARGGHLDVLKWLRLHGCPWGEATVECAVLGDHLDCLVYAIEHGCPFDVDDVLRCEGVDGCNQRCIDYIENMEQ
ncbi:Ankyrin repeat domain containing protein [Pandoravirus dulcis]|uniref:Ankyrin repeat domain containing protein n=1 Tax=Pandoravirus dulcis TaxID=1349409 RepID=S4VVT7_9VIRU|nr:Ankyrin repeat domain containing protein [Pandoravirus dulcis]AGO82216.1 Ankyrin repeat domain containing protein [Pandoravirus dulcis]